MFCSQLRVEMVIMYRSCNTTALTARKKLYTGGLFGRPQAILRRFQTRGLGTSRLEATLAIKDQGPAAASKGHRGVNTSQRAGLTVLQNAYHSPTKLNNERGITIPRR